MRERNVCSFMHTTPSLIRFPKESLDQCLLQCWGLSDTANADGSQDASTSTMTKESHEQDAKYGIAEIVLNFMSTSLLPNPRALASSKVLTLAALCVG